MCSLQNLGLEEVGVKLNKQGAIEVVFCLSLFVCVKNFIFCVGLLFVIAYSFTNQKDRRSHLLTLHVYIYLYGHADFSCGVAV